MNGIRATGLFGNTLDPFEVHEPQLEIVGVFFLSEINFKYQKTYTFKYD